MFEVQVWGTTVEYTNYFRDAEQAFKESHGEVVMFKFEGSKKKVIKQRKARGFKLKDIARM